MSSAQRRSVSKAPPNQKVASKKKKKSLKLHNFSWGSHQHHDAQVRREVGKKLFCAFPFTIFLPHLFYFLCGCQLRLQREQGCQALEGSNGPLPQKQNRANKKGWNIVEKKPKYIYIFFFKLLHSCQQILLATLSRRERERGGLFSFFLSFPRGIISVFSFSLGC